MLELGNGPGPDGGRQELETPLPLRSASRNSFCDCQRMRANGGEGASWRRGRRFHRTFAAFRSLSQPFTLYRWNKPNFRLIRFVAFRMLSPQATFLSWIGSPI